MSLALLCPGQGAQHAAMFDRVRDLPAARHTLDVASTVLGRDVFAAAAADDRFDNVRAQPLLCAASLAHWQGLREVLPTPAVIAGYSIGELAAHAIAGGVDAATCLALAAQRALLMDSASPADAGLQAVLGLERHVLQPLCDLHGAHVAIANGQDHFIVGGTHASLQRLADAARPQGADIRPLPVHVPAHTPLLAAAVAPFAAALDASPLQVPRLPLLAGIDARPVRDRATAVHTLSAQLAQTIEWAQVMRQAFERGARVFLQLGPGNALARMVAPAYPCCEVRAVEEFQSLEGAAAWVRSALERLQ
ncbi:MULTISPECIES: malonate decarboxylase subunit epsilon [unclassified Stenotrophomonas]|uniref:malonate decarboxylase subunit epsilon n=1 Tax=unclassified Stenotrophomonas TaxID=196198 RepID=UPI00244B3748|nr:MULTISPECIES: malonate decarboxylase subunit epsilon [unclassified Stenotrophomonas]MBN5161836.1 malonate decarboxylase subunit epsilon [Stenotrophomonas maltophilia]MDG9845703.1 malonate decarboxylase subunit epsilon [Stenotrophomonas sp. GD04054]MDH0019135.1 malonate decarboxylase subunit epsilon [Stenotrophomonas sp. GD04028]MDH0577163.1 malonate decarboxylase subunit epsilon [Stenotrophomonas sp. GD03997]MDH0862622.1 malonate decarboxylase subunit epsilon [Stenotrophomonas sp. GD03882]